MDLGNIESIPILHAILYDFVTYNPTIKSRPIISKLRLTQNKALRNISKAYRATVIKVLESKTFIPPLDVYLDQKAIDYTKRVGFLEREEYKAKVCREIRLRTRRTKRGRKSAK